MEYSIGLDIGTTSIGWACIDQNYELLKYQGKWALGVREFEAAQSAEFTRQKRQMRRRYNRRKKRIQLLQQLFREHMPKGFFGDTNVQYFWQNDNRFENKTLSEVLRSLHMNPRKFPTIYHLRKNLIQERKQYDLRLVYLAIHNLVKYRGHFLTNGRWHAENKSINFYEDCEDILQDYAEINGWAYKTIDLQRVKEIMENPDITRKDKVKELEGISSKSWISVWNLLVGLLTDAQRLFPESTNVEQYRQEKIKISLASENLDEIRNKLTETENEWLDRIYVLYQQIMLQDLLQGYECVAMAKVASYEQYQKDLQTLKVAINEAKDEKLYRQFFITPKKVMNSYLEKPNVKNLEQLCLLDQYNLSHELKMKNKILEIMKKALLASNVINRERFTEQLLDGTFLVYQKGVHNAAIPNQNNIYEVETILRHQRVYYPFMTEEWIEKVVDILSFRIPYYIGPLAKEEKSRFAWVKRTNSDGPTTPFNFAQNIDESTSAEQFIKKMTNKCTYLQNEDVLPKQSLLYQYFEVLNELNGIQIRPLDAEKNSKYRLSKEAKKCVIEKGFRKYKTMTHQRLLQVLEVNGFAHLIGTEDEKYQVYGTQKEDRFASSMQSYITFTQLFQKSNVPFDDAIVEQIIEWLTIFTENSIVRKKINEVYPLLPSALVEQLIVKRCTGWGNLSKKLIDGLILNDGQTVIEKMETTSLGFRQILSPQYSNLEELIKEVNGIRKNKGKKITYADIQSLAGSPSLKRGIWQAIKVVEELVSIFGEPKHIMVEVAREEGAKKRSTSRQKYFEKIVKGLKKDEKTLKDELSRYLKEPELKFQDNRFYLYLLQQGKCAYSGQALDITKLSFYEIDHIYPQSFVKDDSLDNLVLVKKSRNQLKSDFQMPLEMMTASERVQMKQKWKEWFEKGFMTEKKYQRLCKNSFTDIDRENFIARQLVETRQIIKQVGVLLEEHYAHTAVHLVKAPIVSKFRKVLEIPKLRDLNNKHHAIDALLNVLLIQHAIQKYGRDIFEFSHQTKKHIAEIAKTAQKEKHFFLFKSFLELSVRRPIDHKMVPAKVFVEEIYYHIPWQTTKKIGSTERAFFDETICSFKTEEAKYESAKTARYVNKGVKPFSTVVIRYTEKQKKGEVESVGLVKLLVLEEKQWKQMELNDDEKALKLAKRNYPKKEIVRANWIKELPKYQKILWKGQMFYLAGANELHVATPFILPKDLLMSYLQMDDQTTEDELQSVYHQIANKMFEQYPIYAKGIMPEKVEKLVTQIHSLEDARQQIAEIFKATMTNATRSEILGSRLSKAPDVHEMKVIDESITGLKVRKPKKLD